MVTAWPWNLPERSAARGSQIPRTTRDHAPCNPALNAWMRSLNYSSRKTTERKDLRMNPRYGTKFKLEQYFHKSGWNGKMNIIYRELVKLLANMWLKSTLSLWTYVKKKKIFLWCLCPSVFSVYLVVWQSLQSKCHVLPPGLLEANPRPA